MNIRGFTLFKRGAGYEGKQSHYVIAAWHNPKSITWSWILWWWPIFGWKHPFGIFHFATQKPMWRKQR